MNIKFNNPDKNITFTALHVARVKNKIPDLQNICIDIYKTTEEDINFINNLKKSTDLHKLMPEMRFTEADVWQELFNIAADKAKYNGYVAFHNNKPCGLMKFTPSDSAYYLDIICTIPTDINKKIPNVGKSLMGIMFDEFAKSKAPRIELAAVTNAPFHAVSKYMRLGFKQTGGENGVGAMKLLKDSLPETLKKLKTYIRTEYLKNPKKINLENLQKNTRLGD